MQQLMLIFEIVLVVAIVAGAYFCWTPPSNKERDRLRNPDQNSI